MHNADLRIVLCDNSNLFGDLNAFLVLIKVWVGQIGASGSRRKEMGEAFQVKEHKL